MAFDKKAYNREYYKTHKSLWDKYREGGSSSGNTTYTTASPLYTPKGSAINSARRGVQSQLANRRYGTYGNAIAKSEADKKRREHAVRSSNEAVERRKRSEQAANRYSEISKRRAAAEYLKKNFDESWDWHVHDKNNPALRYDKKKDRYVGREKNETAWQKAKKRVQSGARSYASNWKIGAKDISRKAQKARKKATNFIKNLFG